MYLILKKVNFIYILSLREYIFRFFTDEVLMLEVLVELIYVIVYESIS
jgi:hypothetical protein